MAPLAALLALVAASLPAVEVSPPPSFGERVEVRLVNVELLVTDRRGEPVLDLHPSEVTISEDGVPVAISHFARYGEPGAAAGGKVGPVIGGEGDGEPPPVHLAVFLDEVHVGPAGRQRALEEVADTLEARLRPVDRVMVVLYDGGNRIVLPFTTDRGALRRALREAAAPSAARLHAEQERRFALDLAYRDATVDNCLYMESIVRNFAEQEYARVRQALAAFGAVVGSLRGIEGRKAVLHVSDGIPILAGAEIADYGYEMCSGTGLVQGQPGATSVEMTDQEIDRYNPATGGLDATRYDTSAAWTELTAQANAGNVSIYALQAGRPPGSEATSIDEAVTSTSLASRSRRVANLQDTLFLLAEETGGRASLHGGPLAEDLARVTRELRSYYLVSYEPPPGERPGTRKIRVEVARPGVQVRHRKAYRARGEDETVADQLLARMLYAPRDEGSPLDLQIVSWEPRPGDGSAVRLRLQIPPGALVPAAPEPGMHGLFTVFMTVGDGSGGIAPIRQTLVPVRQAEGAPRAQVIWEVEAKLRSDQDTVGLALRDELSGETRFLVRRLDPPRR